MGLVLQVAWSGRGFVASLPGLATGVAAGASLPGPATGVAAAASAAAAALEPVAVKGSRPAWSSALPKRREV